MAALRALKDVMWMPLLFPVWLIVAAVFLLFPGYRNRLFMDTDRETDGD